MQRIPLTQLNPHPRGFQRSRVFHVSRRRLVYNGTSALPLFVIMPAHLEHIFHAATMKQRVGSIVMLKSRNNIASVLGEGGEGGRGVEGRFVPLRFCRLSWQYSGYETAAESARNCFQHNRIHKYGISASVGVSWHMTTSIHLARWRCKNVTYQRCKLKLKIIHICIWNLYIYIYIMFRDWEEAIENSASRVVSGWGKWPKKLRKIKRTLKINIPTVANSC